ncbi:MAG: MoaD/ThiS family protein [Candidatus Thiodiazotropha sp.]
MQVEFKLYASLMAYLPAEAKNNAVSVKVAEGATIFDLMDRYQVPRQQAHLVVCNGLFLPPSQRERYRLRDGDVVALWPPVAGG